MATLTTDLGAQIAAALNWTFGAFNGTNLLGFVLLGLFGLIAVKWHASIEVIAITMIPLSVILVTANLLPVWFLFIVAAAGGLAVAMLFNKVKP
jgi:hypothetical protein